MSSISFVWMQLLLLLLPDIIASYLATLLVNFSVINAITQKLHNIAATDAISRSVTISLRIRRSKSMNSARSPIATPISYVMISSDELHAMGRQIIAMFVSGFIGMIIMIVVVTWIVYERLAVRLGELYLNIVSMYKVINKLIWSKTQVKNKQFGSHAVRNF